MPKFKKVYTESYRSGFYHPISILILALITLTVALAIFANSGFFSNKNVPAPPSPTPQLSPKPTPKTTPAAQTANPDLIGVNWKTYKSDSGKFSLKYPLDWSVKTTSPDSAKTYISDGKSSISWRTDSQAIDFDTLYNYPIGVYMQGTKQISSSSKIKNLQIGRYRGTMVIPGTCKVCTNFEYKIIADFEPGAPLTEIIAATNTPNGFLQKDLFIQILSTFQFLD